MLMVERWNNWKEHAQNKANLGPHSMSSGRWDGEMADGGVSHKNGSDDSSDRVGQQFEVNLDLLQMKWCILASYKQRGDACTERVKKFTTQFSLNRPHWDDSVIESPCPSVCGSVVLRHPQLYGCSRQCGRCGLHCQARQAKKTSSSLKIIEVTHTLP